MKLGEDFGRKALPSDYINDWKEKKQKKQQPKKG
jgi:hypothetical protein